jgi:hypothetical protein
MERDPDGQTKIKGNLSFLHRVLILTVAVIALGV